jgi:hypothetical protein
VGAKLVSAKQDVRRIAALWPAATPAREARSMLICWEKRLVTASTCTGPETERGGMIRRKRKAVERPDAPMQPLYRHR